jgi:Regulator of chromosome condensation (RCC1) repeat/Immunoglobulin I-set domain
MKSVLRALAHFSFWLSMVSVSPADPVMVWGYNDYGQTNVPPEATNVIALAAGDHHCLALRADGTVVAWGGDSTRGQTNVPPGLTNVVSIAAGSAHSLALGRDGTVTLWGRIPPFAQQSAAVPVDATNIAGLALGSGAQHALFLRSDGTVEDWGNVIYGWTNVPPNARNVVAVAAGSLFGLALRADGKVVAWGDNGFGQTDVPSSATNIVAIATGFDGSAALRADGTVLVWGTLSSPIIGLTNIVDLACPFGFQGFPASSLLALRGNGTVTEYQATAMTALPPYPTNNVAAIAAGSGDGLMLVGSGPPAFSGMPVIRTVAVGSRAYFRAVAVGAMPISYQWTCNGTNLPIATNTVLVLTNVQPEQAGNSYSLIASNALGAATNGAMILNELPVDFAIQPQPLTAPVGATANFTTAYTNGIGPFTFQWQFANANLSGATNSSLSLTNVQLNQAGAYSLIVSNSYGNATNTAILTVTPPVFNTGSTNLVITTNGLQLRLDSVYATNAVFIFASTDLVNWLPIFTNPPATGSVLFLDADATNLPQRFYRAMEQ